MPHNITQFQFLRGTEAQNDAYTGASGEVTVDITNNQLRLHDGVTAGGHLISGSGGSGSSAAFPYVGTAVITGSLVVSGSGITGSLFGTASRAISSSYAISASRAVSTELVDVLTGGSTTGLGLYSGSFSGSFRGDGSLLTGLVASGVGIDVADDGVTQANAERLDFGTFITATVASSTASINVTLPAGTVSSSVQINTGSFSGSFTGILTGTASRAISASRADSTEKVDVLTGGSTTGLGIYSGSFSGSFSGDIGGTGDGFPYTGNAVITGSLYVSGSGITGSLLGTASYAVTSSYVLYTNATDNRVLTSTGSGGINAEANLTFDGNLLTIISASRVQRSGVATQYIQLDQNTTLATLPVIASFTDTNAAKPLTLISTTDIANTTPSAGENGFTFNVRANTALAIKDDGKVGIGTTAPANQLQIQGNVSASTYTSSVSGVGFVGTSSYAVTSSYSISSSYAISSSRTISASRTDSTEKVDVLAGGSTTGLGIYSGSFSGSFTGNSTTGLGFPFSGSAVITGSLYVSGSGITGSLFGTASRAISSSFAVTSSYIIPSGLPAGTVSASGQINHDATANHVPDQHVAHSGVSTTAGSGLSGGGTIASTRTLTLDTSSAHFTTGVVRSLPAGTVSSSTQQVVSTYTNGIDNRVVTSTGASGINGEANLTFDGSTFTVTGNLDAQNLHIDGFKSLDTVAGNTINGVINPVWGMLQVGGRKLYYDEEFAVGSNSVNVYNNNGGSAVTHTRKSSSFSESGVSPVPNASGWVIELRHASLESSGTSPGYGGWYFGTDTSPGSRRLLVTFRMKIPTGRWVNYASNNIGEGGQGGWLTNVAGTDLYQDYAYLVHSGTGSFSSTHFYYIDGGDTSAFYTYLASATVYDVTNVSTQAMNSLAVGYNDTPPNQGAIIAGNVGIGTNSPDVNMSIVKSSGGLPASSGTTPTTAAMRVKATANNAMYLGMDTATPFGGWLQVSDITALETNYPILLNPIGGNVGIGTSAPANRLQIAGNVSASSYTSSVANGVGYFGTASRVVSTEKVDVLAGGSTTGLGVYSGSFSGSFSGIASSVVTTYTNGSDNRVVTSTGAAGINGESTLTYDGTTLYVSGALGVGTSTPTTIGLIRATNDIVAYYSSDIRLKANPVVISDALVKLNKISGYEFDWIPAKGVHENEGHDIGVIAQEIVEVLPEIVTTRDNGYMAVKYEKIIPLLIQAIKEQQIQIDELKQRLRG